MQKVADEMKMSGVHMGNEEEGEGRRKLPRMRDCREVKSEEAGGNVDDRLGYTRRWRWGGGMLWGIGEKKGWRDCWKKGKEEGGLSSIRQECGLHQPLRHYLPNLHPLIKKKNKDMHVNKNQARQREQGSRGGRERNK